MLETTLPRLTSWMSLGGNQWRVSTWWPSDSREAMQRSLLQLLAVAHAERLDVPRLVSNLADEHRGAYRRRLRRLARRLHDGTPLVDALEQTPDVLPDPTVLAIRFGTQTGTLATTYQRLAEAHDPRSSRLTAGLRQTLLYAATTLLLVGLVLAFLFIFIMPALATIQEEFTPHGPESEPPWAFAALTTLCEVLVNYAPLWILGVVVMATLIWSAPARRYFRRHLATRWIGGIAQVRSAELLQLLSIAVERGRPIPSALSTLARYHFDAGIGQRLMFARIEAEHRGDIWNILSESRLLTPDESSALAAASSDRSRAWMMWRLADWKLDRAAWRSDAMIVLLRPALVLVFASIVLLIAAAMIGYLAQLILELA